MNTLICPTCGCSLVRLGLATQSTPSHQYLEMEYRFCCAECRDQFVAEPKRYLQETSALQVCPVCLAEKPESACVRVMYDVEVFYFCRCPRCLTEFHKRPSYFIDRLAGRLEYAGVFGGEVTCCAD